VTLRGVFSLSAETSLKGKGCGQEATDEAALFGESTKLLNYVMKCKIIESVLG